MTRHSALWWFTIAAALSLAAPAGAVTLNWSNAAGGSADAASNWSPAQSPTLNDLLTFNVIGAYTVNFPTPLDSVMGHLFYTGNVTLDCGAPHYGRTLFSVAPSTSNSATVSLTNGSFRTGYDVRVGDAAASFGTLNVQGVSALLTQAPGGPFKVGNQGTGTLSVTSGGHVITSGDLIVGAAPGGTGTTTISGEVT
ncbi:MAG: hypothetical protein ACRENS_12120, partial [Candidatus Eiseniibacteriota bacterium]